MQECLDCQQVDKEVLIFTVKIKLFDGRLQRFNVGHKMTCLDVRRLLTDTLGVTSRESQLVLNGRVINDDTVLNNLVIEDAVLHAVLNLRGD